MATDKDNIELRSEKVRNIIGQIPPRIIRVGITVIFFIIIGFLIGSYYFKYEYTIKTSATIEQRNDTTFIKIKIPANEKNKVKTGQHVILTFDNIQNLYNQRVETKIQAIPNTIQIENKAGYYIAEIIISKQLKTTENETIKLNEKTEVKAEIITDKISFFERMIRPFKNIMSSV